MTDRELLELAAKAAGIERDGEHWSDWWNPLHSDGDALRLAVKLKMTLDILPWRAEASAEGFGMVEPITNNNADVATRRAIVRAAAAIGAAK